MPEAVIDFGNEDDKAKLQGLLSEGGQINQLLGRIGLEADVQQQILLGVSNEIWQTCVADAGSVVELAQRARDCTIEDVNISQTVDASLKKVLADGRGHGRRAHLRGVRRRYGRGVPQPRERGVCRKNRRQLPTASWTASCRRSMRC